MKVHPFVLESPLSPQQCIQRLRTSISPQGMDFFTFADFGDERFHGKIAGKTIELRKRKSFFWRNSFAPHLFAELESTSYGTNIVGHFGFGSRVKWLMVVAVVACLSGLCLVAFVKGNLGDQAWTSIFVALAVIAWVFFMPRISYFFSHWHEGELLEFVRNTLNVVK